MSKFNSDAYPQYDVTKWVEFPDSDDDNRFRVIGVGEWNDKEEAIEAFNAVQVTGNVVQVDLGCYDGEDWTKIRMKDVTGEYMEGEF